MGGFISRVTGPPPYPGDPLSNTKSNIESISCFIFLALLLAATIGFSIYESTHPPNSSTLEQQPVHIDHIVFIFSGLNSCVATPYILNADQTPTSVRVGFAPIAGLSPQDGVELVTLDPTTGKPVNDLSNFALEFAIFSENNNGRCEEDSTAEAALALIVGPITPSSLNKVVYVGLGTKNVVDVFRNKITFANGTTALTFSQSTRFASVLTDPQLAAFSTVFFSTQVTVTKFDGTFGLFKRVIVDIGSIISGASFIAAIFVFIAIRSMRNDPAAWFPHTMRETALYTMDRTGMKPNSQTGVTPQQSGSVNPQP